LGNACVTKNKLQNIAHL